MTTTALNFSVPGFSSSYFRYRKAAAQNHARAQDKLGVHLQMGLGILQNMTLAVKYFSLSAQQDQVSAQYHLALCYEKGMGIQENLQEALHWYEKAAAVSFMHTKDG